MTTKEDLEATLESVGRGLDGLLEERAKLNVAVYNLARLVLAMDARLFHGPGLDEAMPDWREIRAFAHDTVRAEAAFEALRISKSFSAAMAEHERPGEMKTKESIHNEIERNAHVMMIELKEAAAMMAGPAQPHDVDARWQAAMGKIADRCALLAARLRMALGPGGED